MQKITIITLCSVGLLVSGCISVFSPDSVNQSENFSFILSYTPCGPLPLDYYDSSKNQLTYRPLGETNQYTITLQMTNEELNTIFQKAKEIKFFDLPTEITPPDNMTRVEEHPSGLYELSIINGNISNSVHWNTNDFTEPLFKDARSFSELVYFIRDILVAHKEYRQLPLSAACA